MCQYFKVWTRHRIYIFLKIFLSEDKLRAFHFDTEIPGRICLGLFGLWFLATCSTVQNNFVLYPSQKIV